MIIAWAVNQIASGFILIIFYKIMFQFKIVEIQVNPDFETPEEVLNAINK